jgi:hypothetical protein
MTTRVSMVIVERAGTEDMAMQVAIPAVDAGSGEQRSLGSTHIRF